QESRVRHHSVVGPYRAAVNVPGSPENLDGFFQSERVVVQRFAQALGLIDRGQIRQEYPARAKSIFGVLDDVPRFGHVEDHAVEVDLVDAFGHVAYLDVVLDVLPQHVVDVLNGVLGEVFANLVGGDECAGSKQRHR